MKKTLLLLSTLLIFSTSFAAITEKFVTSSGAGTHDGSSNANAFSWAEMITNINGGGVAGNRYNCRNDATYSRTTTADTISGSGSSTSPVVIRGYSVSITDGYQGRTAGAGLITTNMPAVTYTTGSLTVSGTWVIVECMNFSAATSGAAVAVGQHSVAVRSKFVNSSTNAAAIALSVANADDVAFDCDCSLTGASGGNFALTLGTQTGRAIACRISGGPASCVRAAGTAVVALCTLYAGAGALISANNSSTSSTFIFNTVVGGTSDGINIITGTTALQCVVGNMLTDNSGYGVNFSNVAVGAFVAYNRTRDNTNGPFNLGTDWVSATSYGEVTTDTGGPETDYVASGSNDYRLISASPATSAAQPSSASMGALQRSQNSGGQTAQAYTK